MAEFYRQFAFVSSVLAGFAFTFYGTLLVAAREHRAGAWAAFLAVAAWPPVSSSEHFHAHARDGRAAYRSNPLSSSPVLFSASDNR